MIEDSTMKASDDKPECRPTAPGGENKARQGLRDLLLAGGASAPTAHVDNAYFEALRMKVVGGQK
ncbi:hypothetical protein [Pseudomonas sp. NPDC089406]|uniref:hypothetical protein n=1 Tax=Pseudomonas sp. NPDC089406 TaxID=3364463 RepID=UPI00384EAA91